jgi:hypothetical protein
MNAAGSVSIPASLAFLVFNVGILLVILALNRRAGPSSRRQAAGVGIQATGPEQTARTENPLAASDILGWEFEYARVTASEANAERHTMINFYLLVAGVVATGVLAVAGQEAGPPKPVGALLLWLLVGIGWVDFLGIIRLRQAWHDSAQAMNQIKEFYITHAKELESDVLRGAFHWQAATLPAPDKPWTIYFYSAMLIGLLNSAAYVAGGALLDLAVAPAIPALTVGMLALFGLIFFAFHIWLYFAFLRSKKVATPGDEPAGA